MHTLRTLDQRERASFIPVAQTTCLFKGVHDQKPETGRFVGLHAHVGFRAYGLVLWVLLILRAFCEGAYLQDEYIEQTPCGDANAPLRKCSSRRCVRRDRLDGFFAARTCLQ